MAADRVAEGRGASRPSTGSPPCPTNIAFDRLVDLAKLRWRIERDYQELKQELGLGHYEGRGWRGFHHHATLCIAAYGFLISERETIPPSRTACRRVSRRPAFPTVIDPEAPPIRPERHVPNSIATMRRRLDCRPRRELCRDVPAAQHPWLDTRNTEIYDAVRLVTENVNEGSADMVYAIGLHPVPRTPS